MLRVLLHMLLLPAMLWLDRRSGARPSPVRSAAAWYAAGLPLIAVESMASAGPDRAALFLRSLLVALCFVPSAYAAFLYAARTGRIGRAFLLYLPLAVACGFLAAFALAQLPSARAVFP